MRPTRTIAPLLLLAALPPMQPVAADQTFLTVGETACEYAANPLGVETPQPRFTWVLQSSQRGQLQSAYHILVATSQDKLAADIGDQWDSGKQASDQSVNVTYQGSPLTSAQRCYWKVRCWDSSGRVSPWSQPAWFEMGLLKPDDWKANWIGIDSKTAPNEPGNAPAPLLRKCFPISKPIRRARAYISGIGWSELYLNGRKIGDRLLDPAITDYARHVLYVVHDVTRQLTQGSNAVGVVLGNGWYSNHKHFTEYGKWGDSPRLLLQINVEFADGTAMTVASDETWKASTGPILRNDIYGGEIYDARLEKPGWHTTAYDDSGWAHAVAKKPPGGQLTAQLMPPIKALETINPVKLTNPKPGIYVYDLGQVFAGWARLRVKGPAGAKVTIKYSERILSDTGLLDERIFCYPGLKSTDEYTLKGDPQGEVYSPTFAFHPVRYVQIAGYPGSPTPDDLQGIVVHTAEDLAGDFHCSNDLLNQVHRNAARTLRNALFGMPMDCIYREPISYVYLSGVYSVLSARKHMPLFWTKWLRDVRDTQDQKGAISAIVPCYSVSQLDTAFGGIYPVLVWYCHQCFADDRILTEHYDAMKKWVDYLASLAPDDLMVKGTYGDHMAPGESPGKEEYISKETPPPLIWTAYYYLDVSVMARAAHVLHKADDARHYAELARRIREAFNDKWFDRKRNQYASGTQTSNLVPLAIGLVPETADQAVIENVVNDITDKYHGRFHAGDIGVTCMIDTFADHGHTGLLYKLATATTYPGWGYMVKQGATTIWESWGRSWPHSTRERHESMIMFCSIEKLFYEDLAGIRGPAFHATHYTPSGYRHITIRPHVVGDLQNASASVKTVRGILSSAWNRTDDGITLDVTIPVNAQAKISVPKLALKNLVLEEGGTPVWRDNAFLAGVPGVSNASETPGDITLEIGSGQYHFKLTGTASQPH